MSARKTVLFVDDDVALLQLVGELMRHRSGDTWEVLLADSAANALGRLKEHAVDLLVVDARMPVMSGLQLIRLARPQYPHVPAVLLTGYADEQDTGAYLREGVDTILEKPRSPEGYETLFLSLKQLLEMERHKGFRGLLDRVDLQDIIQLECLRRKSSVLDVFTKAQSGEITIRNGAIVHAQAGELTGEAAFNHLLTLRGGEFRLKPYREPEQITIERSWENLLMEAAQMRDEVTDQINNTGAAPAEQPGTPRTTLPKLALLPGEDVLEQPTKQFVAVSADGDPLLIMTPDAGLVAAMQRMASTILMWDCAVPIGRPELFEATTLDTEVAVQFQPEAAVLAIRSRRSVS